MPLEIKDFEDVSLMIDEDPNSIDVLYFTIADKYIDHDDSVCFECNKEQAIQIIKHLKEQFSLNP